MNGAESLIHTALAAGVDTCFANPGTTELPLVAALDSVPGVRSVLAVFEGVCSGAADGYGRMLDRPAMTLVHLGPGFANAIANLHNARRARSPIINLIGDQATWHLDADAPLTSDIHSLASPVSGWVHRTLSAKELASDFAAAYGAAMSWPGRVATLIAPADCQWEAADGPAPVASPAAGLAIDANRVDSVAESLRGGRAATLLLGARALRADALDAAARVATATGARLVAETFPARVERGAGRPAIERLPYFPDQAREFLAASDVVVLVGAKDPVSFFGYEGQPVRLASPDSDVPVLAAPEEDAAAALVALAEAVGGPAHGPVSDSPRAERPSGDLNPVSLGAALAALQPEGAIVVDEGATSGGPYFGASAGAPPHSYLALTGGAIGQGMPCATGAAVACPDRQVLSLQADGSALYTAQALWTQARESLDVVTLLCSNRAYRILQVELARAGIAEPGPTARALTDLSGPAVDWVSLAQGYGVPASRVETAESLVEALERGIAESGPRLIEVVLD